MIISCLQQPGQLGGGQRCQPCKECYGSDGHGHSRFPVSPCLVYKHLARKLPSGDWFLILLGRGKWQHLDFKVNVKGSFVFKNEKDKQQMLVVQRLHSVSKLQSWLDPDWNAYRATNNSKRSPHFVNQARCPQPAGLGVLHRTSLTGWPGRGPEQPYPPPLLF